MFFVLSRCTGLTLIVIADVECENWLSGYFWEHPSSAKKFLSHVASIAATPAAKSSASDELCATLFSRFAIHDTAHPANLKTKPHVDSRVSGHLA